MSFIHTPKNYTEALEFFFTVPFYSFSDLYGKKPLIFKKDEIQYAILKSTSKPSWDLYYSRIDYEGYVTIKRSLTNEELSNIQVRPEEKGGRAVFKKLSALMFRKNSIAVWYFLIATILWISIPLVVFSCLIPPYDSNPEILKNTLCNKDCILSSGWYLSRVYHDLSFAIAMTLVSLYFIFFKIKVMRNAEIVGYERQCAYFFIYVCILFGYKSINKINGQNFKIAHNAFYHNEYFKNSNSRKIASEIEAMKFSLTNDRK
ncbi:MAG: hypothetical protein ACXVLQ_09095 [Bacteriovorax sp.]